jgi:predicted nucleic acid-binding protein
VNILPDTSVWVDYLNGADASLVDQLDGSLDRESVFVCGPVMAELLVGTAPEDREDLWLAVGSLPWVDLDQVAWREVGELGYTLRQLGTSVPLVDVAIAVAALNGEAELWTRDSDFTRIQVAAPDLVLHSG